MGNIGAVLGVSEGGVEQVLGVGVHSGGFCGKPLGSALGFGMRVKMVKLQVETAF